ncbi:hypothetical protein F4813DRAFT_124430 [Daldinia decipiens]|uniref:uncharacterized protein n=1 Tax=Daldinia decipiens TaxID=326647 RepID=UPI0020C55C74|nr:uncharacterized protein F4813DRAFT_124430 [Daldinia decipiens]KAI1656745.1 hypothetical protein F4813DRAFT_124430 [Daldinia decipiens]
MAVLTANARKNFIACVVMLSLATIAVLMRFLIKFVHQQRLHGADWLCLASLAFLIAYCSLVINFIFNVSLFHAYDIYFKISLPEQLTEMVNLLKYSYATELLFTFVISSVKLSILWFYYDLFAVNNRLRILIQVTAAACTLWFLVATFVLAFQCQPVEAFWEKLNQAPWCLDTPRVLLGYELTNLFLDATVLCIPIVTISRLNLPTSKKISVLSILLLGALVCIASIIRLTAIWNPSDILRGWDFGSIGLWSTIQLGLAIVCSCLPTFGPLLPILKQLRSIQGLRELLKLRLSNTSSFSRTSKVPGMERPWARIKGAQHNVTSRTWAEGNNDGSEVALEPITFKEDSG